MTSTAQLPPTRSGGAAAATDTATRSSPPPPPLSSSSSTMAAAVVCATAQAGTSAAAATVQFAPPPPPPHTYYQFSHPFELRCRLSAHMRARYTGYIPIIFEPHEQCLAQTRSDDGHGSRSSGGSGTATTTTTAADAEAHTAAGGASPLGTGVRDVGSSSGSGGSGSSGGAAERLSTLRQRLQSWWGGEDVRGGDGASTVAQLRPPPQGELKFMMPAHKTVSEVILTLRERLVLPPHQAVFLSVGDADVLAPGSSQLGDLYERYRHRDGFLYISYALENTFG